MKKSFGKNKKIFKIRYQPYYSVSRIIKDYTMSAIFIGIAILINYTSNFIKFEYLAFDFSLFTITLLSFKVRKRMVYAATIIISLANFINSSAGWIGVMIVSLNNIFFITIFLFLKKILINNKHKYWKLLLVHIIASFATIMFNVLMNGLLYTPLYWYSFKIASSINFIQVQKEYEIKPNLYLLNFKKYWAGVFVLYFSFNLIKYTVITFISFILIKVFEFKNKKEIY